MLLKSILLSLAVPVVCIVVVTCRAGAESNSPTMFVEQQLGGLRVSDPLVKARSMFPGLVPGAQKDVWQAEVDGGCLLTISSALPMKDTSPIETIVLERKKSRLSSVCETLTTGKGLGLEAKLEDVKRLYGSSLIAHEADGKTVFVQDNGAECLSGKSNILRSLLVYWSEASSSITMLVVDGSKAACLDYRSSVNTEK